jgi:predicted nucleotidyltransferase component of viral defense system
MERFLYRLARSEVADMFVLKGALLLTAWRAPLARPTMDIDLAGKTNNELTHIAAVVANVCDSVAEPDGIDFNRQSIEVKRIKEDAEYEGVRVRFQATLAKAVIPMQIDIGFGDVIIPAPMEVTYPTLLDFPAPMLRAYPKEVVIAEKLEALTALGLLNSRLKDYYDIAVLSRLYSFEGKTLSQAVRATFQHRGTAIQSEPVGLSDVFHNDPARMIQWRAFLRRSRFQEEPLDLQRLVMEVRQFALPILDALSDGQTFVARWPAAGPWSFRK